MKRKKLLKKLQSLLDGPHDARKKDIDKLQEVIRELKLKQKQFESGLDKAEDKDEQDKIHRKIEVIKLQLNKGAVLLAQLKGEDDDLD